MKTDRDAKRAAGRLPKMAAWAVLASCALAQPKTNAGEPSKPGADPTGSQQAPILVTAPRTDMHGTERVDASALRHASQATTVDGFLEDMAGIDLGRRSFAGNESHRLSIRGFDESRSLILLDGRSLHGAGVYGGYYVDWAALSLENVEAIDVIRGMTPVRFGNTLGGVVDIHTRRATARRTTEFRAGGGSLGTWEVQGTHVSPSGTVACSVSAGHYATDGYLRNAFVERDTVHAKLQLALPGQLSLDASARYARNRAGMIVYNMPDAWAYDPHEPDSLDALLGGPFPQFRQPHSGPLDWGEESYWRNSRLNLGLGLSRETDELGFSLQTWLTDEDREEYFYAVDNSAHLILRRDSEPENNNWGWRTDLRHKAGAGNAHAIDCGLEGQYLGYGGMRVKSLDSAYFAWPPYDSPSKDEPVTQLHGFYVQDRWQIAESLLLEAGLRADLYRADGPEANAVTVDEQSVAPRLACSLTPWPGGTAAVRLGQAYRFPTNPEYYWWYSGYRPDSRKDLTAEKANQVELEIEQAAQERVSFLARGYYYQVDDYIRTLFGYPPSRVVYNIDRVEFAGVELGVAYDVLAALRISANITHQQTRKHGDVLDGSTPLSDELAELPEYKAHLKMAYGRGKGPRVEIKTGYVDKRWATRGSPAWPGGSYLAAVDSYVDVDVRVSYPLYRDQAEREVRLELTGENVLDQDIVEEYGYPMPGATWMAGVRVVF
ncbi:MAG: TonB-dependent receptor [Kiritimatiellae bacterium]|nr:TonB-dependent receptor [Kiritimatiellia bacterium]